MKYPGSWIFEITGTSFRTIFKQGKEEISQSVFRILEEREKYSDKTQA